MSGNATWRVVGERSWPRYLRLVAGTAGAYGFTSVATVTLSLSLGLLGLDKIEAVMWSTLASFLIFSAIAITVFHSRSVVKTHSH